MKGMPALGAAFVGRSFAGSQAQPPGQARAGRRSAAAEAAEQHAPRWARFPATHPGLLGLCPAFPLAALIRSYT